MSLMVLISPAKKLAEGVARRGYAMTQPMLLSQAETLMALLRPMDSFAIAELMKLSMSLADLNMARFQHWRLPFTHDNAMQALFAFRGDVYRALDVDTLDHDAIGFSQQHFRILSGLYGLLRPLDLMQPYRLEMGTRLANGCGPNLYAFWRQSLVQALQQSITEIGATHVINLASQEYFKAVDSSELSVAVVTPLFKQWHRGQYRVIGIHAKRARGLMCRQIVQHRITDPEALKVLNIEGYYFDPAQSCGSEWVFVKERAL
ncbi:MAG: peroxide stress protein YaaA [Mariprofundales bacterium]